MKKLIILTLAALMLLTTMFTGCVRVDLAEKNGPITTKNYDFTGFTGIDIGHAFDLTVTPSDKFSVSITAGANLLEHIDVHLDGATLVFGIDGWTDIWFSSWIAPPKVNITMPALNVLMLSGAARANVAGFRSSQDFDLHLSGAGEINMDMETGDFISEISGASRVDGALVASSSDIELSGASHIRLIGSGGDIKLHGSGASDANLKDYAVHNADINFSGASHVSLMVTGRMDVSLSGASSLDYAGHPDIAETDITGASKMSHIESPNTDTY
jgi:hypothetical protein